MSDYTHCDGPACPAIVSVGATALEAPDWIHVSEGQGALEHDFCSKDCLTRWSAPELFEERDALRARIARVLTVCDEQVTGTFSAEGFGATYTFVGLIRSAALAP